MLKLVDYYILLNNKVPEEVWTKVTKSNYYIRPLQSDETSILANVDETIDLRNFIGCIFNLLRLGYKYEIDFEFSAAS